MTFVRVPGIRQFRQLANSIGQFFLLVYCADGSLCEYGPFCSGEEMVQCQRDLENNVFEYNEEF